MRNFIEDKLTPVNSADLLYAIAKSFKTLTGQIPSKNTLCVLLSQISLECGPGLKSCHNFNLGNIKSSDSDSYDYSYFRCSEILNGVEVWFSPPHPACRFRAFATIDEGVLAHLTFLKNRYKPATGIWQSILDGDPAKFAHLLKINRYYTASESLYTKGVVNLFNQFQKLDYDPSKINHELTDEDRKKISMNMEMFNWEILNDLAKEDLEAVETDITE